MTPIYPNLEAGYSPFTKRLLTSWDIQVAVPRFESQIPKHRAPTHENLPQELKRLWLLNGFSAKGF